MPAKHKPLRWQMVGAAVAGAAIVGGAAKASSERKAASRASDAQQQAADAAIAENRYQFDKLQELFAPYVEAGTGALTAQQDLLGLNGDSSQARALENIQNSPQFLASVDQGENAILANASATGGLRGGNTNAALAQFRPSLLANMINQRFGQLGGITALGQNSAAGVGNAGMQMAGMNGNMFQQRGAALAGGAMGRAKADGTMYDAFGNAAGAMFGGGQNLAGVF